jgi:hypothetical protein
MACICMPMGALKPSMMARTVGRNMDRKIHSLQCSKRWRRVRVLQGVIADGMAAKACSSNLTPGARSAILFLHDNN